MSDFAVMQSASREAQRTIAGMQGMSRGGTNGRINGADFVFVYGVPEFEERMLAGGGYRRRVELIASATRDQFDAPPAAKIPLTRTDITPAINYTVEAVGTHDPLRYVLVLVKAGGE